MDKQSNGLITARSMDHMGIHEVAMISLGIALLVALYRVFRRKGML